MAKTNEEIVAAGKAAGVEVRIVQPPVTKGEGEIVLLPGMRRPSKWLAGRLSFRNRSQMPIGISTADLTGCSPKLRFSAVAKTCPRRVRCDQLEPELLLLLVPRKHTRSQPRRVSHVKWMPALALGVFVLALPAHAARQAESSTMTIRLKSTTVSVKVVRDRAPKRVLNAGDVLSARSILRNAVPQFGKPKGAIVGGDVGAFTVVTASLSDAKGTTRLPGGTIRTAGRVRDARTQTIRVTGGTGTFANARGTCTVTTLDRGGLALNVYRLQLP